MHGIKCGHPHHAAAAAAAAAGGIANKTVFHTCMETGCWGHSSGVMRVIIVAGVGCGLLPACCPAGCWFPSAARFLLLLLWLLLWLIMLHREKEQFDVTGIM